MNAEILDREPSNDPDAELRVLYAMLIEPGRRIDEAAEILIADDFHDGRRQVIFSELLAMHVQRRKIAMDTFVPWLKSRRRWEDAGAAVHLAEIMAVDYARLDTTAENARLVRNCARRRSMLRIAERMLVSASDLAVPVADALESAESALGAVQLGAATEALVDAQ